MEAMRIMALMGKCPKCAEFIQQESINRPLGLPTDLTGGCEGGSPKAEDGTRLCLFDLPVP